MSAERDELAAAIVGYRIGEGYYAVDVGYSDARAIADDLLAAGYKKPRTVTTVEELDALPSDAVIRSVYGGVFVKDGGWWAETGTRDKSLSADLDRPATVLHEGSAS